MSMDLTEPDAGSDLQSVMLKATEQPDGTWRLNGVKRFITNGDSDIHLVLARSEDGTKDGRGLSMFIYDKRDGGVNVRRIENKMGIKGSPTCELIYKNAKAELCGSAPSRPHQICDGPHERSPSRHRRPERRCERTRIPRSPQLCQGPQASLARPSSSSRCIEDARRDESQPRRITPPLRDRPLCRHVQGLRGHSPRARSLHRRSAPESEALPKLADACTPLVKGLGSEYCNQNAYDCNTDSRWLRLHERLRLRTRVPRCPHHLYLRRHHPASGRGCHPPRHHRHIPRPH